MKLPISQKIPMGLVYSQGFQTPKVRFWYWDPKNIPKTVSTSGGICLSLGIYLQQCYRFKPNVTENNASHMDDLAATRLVWKYTSHRSFAVPIAPSGIVNPMGSQLQWSTPPKVLALHNLSHRIHVWHTSGQIIATSYNLTPNGGLVREIPLFQGNPGWWNIIIWPDTYLHLSIKVNHSWNGKTYRTRPMDAMSYGPGTSMDSINFWWSNGFPMHCGLFGELYIIYIWVFPKIMVPPNHPF